MIEINMTDSTEKDDTFDSKYIYVRKIYSLNGKELDINNIESYQDYFHNYYDSITAFDSIIDLGKQFIDIIHPTNIKNINIEKYKRKITKLIIEWLLINPYPYSYINPHDSKDFTNLFVEDCILLFYIYDIHKWLIKINRNRDIIATAPKSSKELENLYSSLETIGFNDFVNFYYDLYQTTDDSPIKILDLNLNKRENIIDIFKSFLERDFNDQNAENFINFLNDNIVKYTLNKIGIREEVNHITILTIQKPFYEPNTNQHRTITSADSIIGIVYNRLLFCLSTTTATTREICHNPSCNNEFDSKNGQLYCKLEKCQKYRERIKSKNSYYRSKEKKANQTND